MIKNIILLLIGSFLMYRGICKLMDWWFDYLERQDEMESKKRNE